MDREPGSWIQNADGSLSPNPDDEAMAARYGLKKPEIKEKEVSGDAENASADLSEN